MKLLLGVMLCLFSVQSFAQCKSDQELASLDWIVHDPEDFARISADVLGQWKAQASDFVFDTEARWMEDALEIPAYARSYDRLSTPQPEMYGDLFVIEHLNTGVPYEVRWYDGKKHVVYDRKVAQCAKDFIPFAVNALF